MPVVSNTSPVLNLAIIGELELLHQQCQQIIIPSAVLEELRVDPGQMQYVEQLMLVGFKPELQIMLTTS